MTGVKCCPRDCPGRYPGCAVGCERWAAYTAEREKTYKARMTSQRIGIILADGQRKNARR